MSLFLRAGDLDFEKVHEVRSMLEVHIAGLAAERASAEDMARLRETHQRFVDETRAADVEAASSVDLEFHRVIARATQNDLFLLLMDTIGSTLIDIRRENLSSGSGTAVTLAQHERVLERIEARDSKAHKRRWLPTSRAWRISGALVPRRRGRSAQALST